MYSRWVGGASRTRAFFVCVCACHACDDWCSDAHVVDGVMHVQRHASVSGYELKRAHSFSEKLRQVKVFTKKLYSNIIMK